MMRGWHWLLGCWCIAGAGCADIWGLDELTYAPDAALADRDASSGNTAGGDVDAGSGAAPDGGADSEATTAGESASSDGGLDASSEPLPDGASDGGQSASGDGAVDADAANDAARPDSGDGATTCEIQSGPPTPHLMAPSNGIYTGSLHAPPSRGTLRPRFKWSPVSAACGAPTYEIQADDSCVLGNLQSCGFTSPELDVKNLTTTEYAPSQDLPVSTTQPVGAAYAWRVRACASGMCSAWSEIRYLLVGRVREDINGDGYGDLLAFSTASGGQTRIEAYLGSPQFDVSDRTTSIPLAGSPGYSEGRFLGDVNGDGYGDLGITLPYVPTSGLVPVILMGGPDLTALSSLQLTKTAGGPSTFLHVRPGGDFNGDGFADIVVQWGYSLTTPQTELRIFYGGQSISSNPDLSIPGPLTDSYTLIDSGCVGDLDADGFPDIGVFASKDTTVFDVFAGGPTPDAVADATLSAPTASIADLQPAGNIYGDGFGSAMLVLSVGTTVYRGSASWSDIQSSMVPNSSGSSGTGAFDINADGESDLLVGVTSDRWQLYLGGASGITLSMPSNAVVDRPSVTWSDHDGDGLPDLVGSNDGLVSGSPGVVWAGSDGTSSPRAFQVYLLQTGWSLSGHIVR